MIAEIFIQPELVFRNASVEPWNPHIDALWSEFDIKGEPIRSFNPDTHVLSDTLSLAWVSHGSVLLSPNLFWFQSMMTYGSYVNDEPEAFYPDIKNKKKLVYETDDEFIPDAFFSSMAQQMNGVKMHQPNLSTNTPLYDSLFKIAAMNSYKKFFTYRGSVTCGIRSFKLEGTTHDWQNVIDGLGKYIHPEPEGDYINAVSLWNEYVRMVQDLITKMIDPNTEMDWWREFFYFRECRDCGVCGQSCPWIPQPRGHILHLLYGDNRFSVPFELNGKEMTLEAGFYGVSITPDHYFVPRAGWAIHFKKDYKAFQGESIKVDKKLTYDTLIPDPNMCRSSWVVGVQKDEDEHTEL